MRYLALSNRKSRIIETAAIITVIAAVSKGFGFFRELVIAYVFGAGAVTDAYAIAAHVVGTAGLLVSTYFSAVFLPSYALVRETQGEDGALAFANNSLGVSLAVNTFLVIILQIAAPLILRITGLDAEQSYLAITSVRILLFMLPMMAFLSMATGYLTSRKSFFGPNIIGFPLNITMITVCLLLGTGSGVVGISLASLFAMAAQIITLSIWLIKEKYRYKFSLRFNTPEIKTGAKVLLPVLLGFAVADLNAWVDTVIASYLGEGSVAASRFAMQLIMFSFLLIGPISGMFLSYLSDYAAKDDTKNMLAVLWKTVRAILLIVFPAIIIAIPTGSDIVRIVYQRGEFTHEAGVLTSSAFIWYLPGLIGIATGEFLRRFFYALQDTKTPMLCGIVSVAVNIALSVSLSRFMGLAGIALATSISACLSSLLLLIMLRRKVGPMGFGETAFDIMKMVISAVPCLLAVIGSCQALADHSPLIRFAASTAAGGVAFLLPAFLLKEMALRDLAERYLPDRFIKR